MFPNARNTNINNSNLTYAGRDHIHAARDVVINPQGLPISAPYFTISLSPSLIEHV